MKILLFLLGASFFVQTMEKGVAVANTMGAAAAYIPFSEYSLAMFPRELKIKFFECVIEDDTLSLSINNVYSLASTCKAFFQIFEDERFINNLILRLEKKVEKPNIEGVDKKTLYYWRLLAVVTKLRNKIALKWFFKKVDTSGPIKDFKRVTSRECLDLTTILNQYYGGLSVAEYRFVNKRPIKILEVYEAPLYGQEKTRPIKSLSLKVCGLVNLDGLLSLSDLETVDFFEVPGNMLSEIDPIYLDRFENLVTLDLANNNLQSINLDVFTKLKKLKMLDLSVNKIQTVLCTVYEDGPDLNKIDLCRNKITYVDPVVLEKVSARLIDLRNNKITNTENLKAISKAVTKRILVDE